MDLADGRVVLHAGDCLEVLASLPENSIDAVVTDPPYHFASIVKRFGKESSAPAQYGTDGVYARSSRGFMGKEWDGGDIAFRPETWALVWRVLKPGGHMVAFGAPKNYHRLACAIEDAGFEIRDSLMWVFGSGFPKSLDVSKAIDKSGGVDVSEFKRSLREYVDRSGKSRSEIDALCGFTMRFDTMREADPIGWGCSLPSPDKWLKICEVLGCDASEYQELINRVWRGKSKEVASENQSMSGANYKRIDKGNPVFDAARQWEGWGTALKPAYEPIVLARKPLSEGTVAANVLRWGTGALNIDATRIAAPDGVPKFNKRNESSDNCFGDGLNGSNRTGEIDTSTGRWPANLCHDGSQAVLDLFPHTKSGSFQKGCVQQATNGPSKGKETLRIRDAREGDEGSAARFFYCAKANKTDRADSKHPTVKPISLMQWLVRLITPQDGTVLDPFAGSGTTGKAAIEEGMKAVLIEREPEYQQDIIRRLNAQLDTEPVAL